MAGHISRNGHDWACSDPVVGFVAPILWYLNRHDKANREQYARPGEGSFWNNLGRFTLIRHYLGEVMENFREAGISTIVMKGALLAESLYPSPGLRYMSDMDVLVRHRDFRDAFEILKKTDWKLRQTQDSSDNLLAAAGDPGTSKDWQMGEGVFMNPKGCVLDLHWHLVPYVWPRYLFCVHMEEVWQEAVPVDMKDIKGALGLSPVHTLTFMCLHLAEHGLKQLRWLLDVDLFVNKYCDSPDWSWKKLVACAREWRVQSAVFHALSFSRFLFNTPIPGHVLKDLDPGPAARARVRVLLRPRELLVHNPNALDRSHPKLVCAALVDRISDLMGFLARLLVPNDAWRRKRYGDDATLLHHWGRVLRAVGED
jgi:Uncharacterised nucleotidyltransferase